MYLALCSKGKTERRYLRTLNSSSKQLVGLLHEELVQGPIKGNVDGGGGLFPAPCPSCLLP